jgi:type 1 glutamine amidotransferase
MKKRPLALSLLLVLTGVACTSEDFGAATPSQLDGDYELLVFSKTAGFRHASIDVAVPAITAHAKARDVAVYATEDASVFTDENLARFDAVIFLQTSGVLRAVESEGQPVLGEEEQAAFRRFIQRGGGYVGIHGASDIRLSPMPPEGTVEWDWYNRLVGGTFHSHPPIQEARIIVADRDHPSTRMLGTEWVKRDEWYNFRELPDHVNVLLALDTESFEGSGHEGHHPIAWYHEYDGGRAFYTALGHTNESFTEEPLFMQHLWGGITWAMEMPEEEAQLAEALAAERAAAPDAARDVVVVTQEQRFNYLTWKIEGAGGTWHYEIESAVPDASPRHAEVGTPSTGFNSAIDRHGNDWIANDCSGNVGGGAPEWRGWPNFGGDGFGHPCRGGGGASRWVTADGTPIELTGRLEGEHLILESWNDDFRLRYHFFPSHAAIEVVQADDLYAFLFEGPIAGQMNIEEQRYVLEDGVPRTIAYGDLLRSRLGHLDFERNFPSPFFYFTDPVAEQVLYIGAAGQSDGGDEGWAQPANMVIFSFGRENDIRALSGTEAVSVFGFLDKDLGHESISSFINARLDNPFASAGGN